MPSATRRRQFHNAAQITTVLNEGSIISKKPGVINMPSWKGVINDAQASAIAAYILAGFPQVAGVAYDADPASASDIYSAYRLHRLPRPGRRQRHAAAGAQPAEPRQGGAGAAQPGRRRHAGRHSLTTIMEGSIPPPGKAGELFMPAWGQILTPAGRQDPAIHPGRPQGQGAAGAAGGADAAALGRLCRGSASGSPAASASP